MPWNKIANIRGPKGDKGDPGASGGGGVGGGVIGSMRLALAAGFDEEGQPLLRKPDGSNGSAPDGEWFDSDPGAPVFIGLHEQASAGEGLSYSNENNTLTYTRDGLFLHTLILSVDPTANPSSDQHPWPYKALNLFDAHWLSHAVFTPIDCLTTVTWLTEQSAGDENWWQIQPVRSGVTLDISRCFLTIAALA